jgi:diketogulonate reductase-like aldo/keto reductase
MDPGSPASAAAAPEPAPPPLPPLPRLGLGTWRYGEAAARAATEVASLRLAFDIGYRLIDTAEMYGAGGAEVVVGRALQEAQRNGLAREDFFVVSKVLPENADAAGVLAACERSRRRLQLDRIDLYLLHWRGSVPLAETVGTFETLQRLGWIGHWGVSNLDRADMDELTALSGGAACATNQVWYSLSARGVEFDLLPWMRERAMPLMAYSPIDQGELADHTRLRKLAQRLTCTPAQLALAWVLAQPGVAAIPKAVHALHLRRNWDAQQLHLSADDLAELDRAFPPPRRAGPLAMR